MSDLEPNDVIIDYTNWRGERSQRRIRPTGMMFSRNEFHPVACHMITALDVEKKLFRTFALANIHSWQEVRD